MHLALLLLLLTAVGWGHPFGSDLYGHRVEVRVSRDRVRVDYLAEISTLDHLRDLRSFLRGVPDPGPADEARYIDAVLEELQGGIVVLADGQRVSLTALPVDEPSGKGDSRFVTFRVALEGPLTPDTRTLNVVNANLPGTTALYASELLVTDDIVVDACSLYDDPRARAPSDDGYVWSADEGSRELRLSYRVRSEAGAAVSRGFRRLAAGGPVGDYQPARQRLSDVEADPLLDVVRGEVTPAAVLMGLALAVFLGALHGLSPGHGKALVAAYLVGSRRKLSHAVWLGLIVTVTHTIAVYGMGIVAFALAESFSPEVVLPWLELASGVLIVGVGLSLLWSRLRALRGGGGHDHEHGHDHGHGHGHDHGHHHAPEDGWRGLVALGVSGGLAPCPSAMVLLLTAIGLQRIGLGLALVFAFSVGLAVLVTGLGVAVILLGDRLRGFASTGPFARALPVVSAVVVTVLGVAISLRGVGSVIGS
ncbi:MAG: sulfite exporter TauE/SafE family protein [Alphaproteobacteria bacterium]|nr:sulfite exporter TauE/SafE family protein [Alphaproteobacteria bacterium]